jgi:uncharacterized protein with PIN domain
VARARFLLDEHLSRVLARELRRNGLDIQTAHEAGLLQQPDEAYVASANVSGRVLVTMDRGFIHRYYAREILTGLVYCEVGTRTIGEFIEALLLVDEIYGADGMMGRFERM